MELMESIGFKDTLENAPWMEFFSDFVDNSPSTALSGARYKEGITQRQLSEKTGIPQRHISEMENGKRVIGRKIARLLSDALNIDYQVFL